MNTTRIIRAVSLAAALATVLGAGSCASTPRETSLAETDRSQSAKNNGSDEARRASRLDAILSEHRPQSTRSRINAGATDDDRLALLRYARVRSVLNAGDHELALQEAKALAELTDNHPDALRLIGDALYAGGETDEALEQWSLAADRGLTAPGPLAVLASQLADEGDWRRVRELTLRAAATQIGDPGLEAIVYALLGKSLLRTNEPVAGAEAILRGVDFDSPFTVRTEYPDEVNLVAADAPALWAEAGHAVLDAEPTDSAPDLALELFGRIPDGAGWADPFGGRYRALIALGREAEAGALLTELSASQAAVLDERVLKLADDARSRSIGFSIADLPENSPLRRGAAGKIWRARLRARSLHPDDGRELLLRTWEAHPGHEGLLMDVLAWPGADNLHARARRAAESTPALAPEIAAMFVSLGGAADPGFIEGNGADKALLAEIAIQTGDRQLIETALDNAPAASTISAACLRARLLGALGRTDEARRVIAAAGEPASLSEATLLAAALDELQLSPRAARVLDGAMRRAESDDPLRQPAARRFVAIAGHTGDAALAERVLMRRLDEDPLNEWCITTLGTLYAQVGGDDARQRLEGIRTRAVRSIPGSRAARRVMLGARAEAGRTGPLESSMAWSLARERPWESALTVLAMQIDLARGEDPEPALRSLLADNPGTDQPLLTLARYLVEQDETQEAASMLQERLERSPYAPGAARLLEQIHAGPLGDTARAAELKSERLQREAFGIDTMLERAAVKADTGSAAEAATLIADAIGPGVAVRSGQRPLLERAVGSVSRAAAADLTGPAGDPALRMLGRLHSVGMAMGPEFLELRAGLAATRPEPDTDAIDEVREIAGAIDPDLADRLRLVPARALQSVGRPDDAIKSVEEAMQTQRSAKPDEIAFWSFLISRTGDAEDLRRMLGALSTLEDAEAAIDQIASDARNEPEGLEGHLAELAYAVASAATSNGRREAAEGLYRVVLEREPAHVWASNDLGYQLAEAGRDLDESLRLITNAYLAEPESASITDSMGWILYRLGYFEDAQDEAEPDDPRPGGRGAITLLQRAIELSGDEPGVTPPMQLGDALWRAGRTDEALDAWELGLAEASRILRTIDDEPGRYPQWYADEVRQRAEGLRDRLGAVERGEDPPAAEVYAPDP